MADCSYQMQSDEYADFIINRDTIEEHSQLLNDSCYYPVFQNTVIAYSPVNSLPNNLFQRLGYNSIPHCYGLMDINSLTSAGLTRTWEETNPNLRGRGTVIGILDTGIDYTHEAFRNPDGSTRILSIWDQTIESLSPPSGFYYGTEYLEEQINSALLSPDPHLVVPSMDELGHGTAMAGIAGGSRNVARRFSGVATEATFIIVKLRYAKPFVRDFFKIPQDAVCYSESDVIIAIKYIYEFSRRLGLPLSLCIGLGTSQGGHDARSPLNQYLDFLSDQRKLGICIAAGNEGSSRHHFMGNIPKNTTYETVNLNVGNDVSGFSMELWGTKPSVFSIDILSPSGEYIPPLIPIQEQSHEITFTFDHCKIYIDYELVESYTGDQLILLRFSGPPAGVWRFRIYRVGVLPASFHIWLPIRAFLGDESYFLRADPLVTITSPGNATLPIVTTAYNPVEDTLFADAGNGFTRTNMKNPSIASPGVNLIVPVAENGGENRYGYATGTSIAAAFTAGVAALLLQYSSTFRFPSSYNTIEMKSVLILGARRRTGLEYPNPEWGYGMLDVYNSLKILEEG